MDKKDGGGDAPAQDAAPAAEADALAATPSDPLDATADPTNATRGDCGGEDEAEAEGGDDSDAPAPAAADATDDAPAGIAGAGETTATADDDGAATGEASGSPAGPAGPPAAAVASVRLAGFADAAPSPRKPFLKLTGTITTFPLGGGGGTEESATPTRGGEDEPVGNSDDDDDDYEPAGKSGDEEDDDDDYAMDSEPLNDGGEDEKDPPPEGGAGEGAADESMGGADEAAETMSAADCAGATPRGGDGGDGGGRRAEEEEEEEGGDVPMHGEDDPLDGAAADPAERAAREAAASLNLEALRSTRESELVALRHERDGWRRRLAEEEGESARRREECGAARREAEEARLRSEAAKGEAEAARGEARAEKDAGEEALRRSARDLERADRAEREADGLRAEVSRLTRTAEERGSLLSIASLQNAKSSGEAIPLRLQVRRLEQELAAVTAHSDYLDGELAAGCEAAVAQRIAHSSELREMRGESDRARLESERADRDLSAARADAAHHTSLPARTKELMSRFLSKKLHFSKGGTKILCDFITSYTSNLNPMPWYEKFSLKNKLRLSMWMLNEIIPHISKFMAKEVKEKDKKDVMWNPSSRKTKDPKEQFDDDPCWSQLGPNDAMTQHQIEKTPLPTDPVSRSIYSLLQLGTFSDLHRPIFTILLFKFILRCHCDEIHLPQGRGRGYLKLQPLAQQTNRLLKSCFEGGVILSNKELHKLCLLLKVRLVGGNRNKDYYLQEMCMKYHFPCDGVVFELKYIKLSPHLQKMNSILNDVIKSDVVMLQPSTDSTSKRYHRNADNSTITIKNWKKVAQRNQPQLITHQTSKFGYKVLAQCVNLSKSPHDNNIRKFMHEKMTDISQLHNKFLTSNGLCNKTFKGAHSLEELETSNEFQLLMTGEVSTIPKSMAFIPEIILPMASIVYEMDIIFYNKQEKKTYIHVYYQSRSITYKLDGLDVTPLIKCLILSFDLNGEYSRNELSLYSSSMPIIVRYNEISMHTHSGFDPGIFGGRKRIGTNASNILPDLKSTKGQTFLDSMRKLMSELDSTASDAFESHDFLGLTSFAEELSTSTTCFTGFGTSVTELSSHLRLPLRTLAMMLRTTDPSQLSHKTICPFFCLKFKMLTAVIVPDKRDKFTFFYGFNSRTEQVECRRVRKYNVLIDRRHAIYLYSTKTNTGYYKPIEGHPARHISFYKTLCTKYSHLSDTCLMEILTMFKEAHAIELLNEKELQDDSLRPHDKTAIMHTHVTSANPRGISLMELLQVGIRHHALMLIFPYEQNGWEACIVHHPLQEESKAESTLATFISQAHVEGIYNQYCIRGMTPVDCESGFYIILYMVIGHRTKNWRHFGTSIKKLSTEEDLSHKVKKWVYRALNGETPKNFIPNWLGQIIQVNSNTL